MRYWKASVVPMLLLFHAVPVVSLTPDERARDLVSNMTYKEKFKLIHGVGLRVSFMGPSGGTPSIWRLKIPELHMSDGSIGVGVGSLFATAFPCTVLLTSSWDPDLVYQYAEALSYEHLKKGINVAYAPLTELARTPFSGRNYEVWGEDPYLASKLIDPFVKAFNKNGVMGCSKHYFGATFEDYARDTLNVNVGEKAFRELYLPPFHAAIKAGIGSFMCAYSQVNGTTACANKPLFDVLYKDLGFKGFVLSDFWAMLGISPLPYLKAGMTMEMPDAWYYNRFNLLHYIRSGEVNMSTIEEMNVRILRSMADVGILDRFPYNDFLPAKGFNMPTFLNVSHMLLCRTVFEESAVLLKNDRILPIASDRISNIAIIGRPGKLDPWVSAPFLRYFYLKLPILLDLRSLAFFTAAGAVLPMYKVSPFRGIKNYLRKKGIGGVKVTWTPSYFRNLAVVRALESDINIVVVQTTAGETVDRPTLEFSWKDNELIETVTAANPNTIVVAIAPGAVVMPWKDKVKGIIMVYHPGQEFGNGLANLLFGDVNPSGKLTISFPKTDQDTWLQSPIQYPGVPYGNATFTEGVFMGYRWYDSQNTSPAYPFGFGLSYTTFDYNNLQVVSGGNTRKNVTFDLTNTGSRSGKEVTQLYLSFPSAAEEPPKNLKGFQKVALSPGQTKTVTMELVDQDFEIWSVINGTWIVVPGIYSIRVGASSKDIKLATTITVS